MNCKFYFIFLLELCTKWDKANSFCACLSVCMCACARALGNSCP